MGMFLNTISPHEKFKLISNSEYFIDKSKILVDLLSCLQGETQYLCVTRPRRFGKTVMANMIAAYFGKAESTKKIFDPLAVSKSETYSIHLNKHDIIYIDFSETPKNCQTYLQYISRIQDGLYRDLAETYPELHLNGEKGVWDNLSEIFEKKNKQKFIFVIDEWDAPFHMPFIEKSDRVDYLLFLKSLLKNKAYVELAYMTGILPIVKYSDGSELNMFLEYDMATTIRFGEYFGFSESEVDTLYTRYSQTQANKTITRNELKKWYNGYHTASGECLYNPRSVISALTNNQLGCYWTSSGVYDSIFYYIRNNISSVREDLAFMAAGERVNAKIQSYAATSMELESKDQIYSAMVVYGLLTYENGEVFIPNKELMLKYEELMLNKESLGYVYRLANESARMLKATLCGDTNTMTQILQYAHNTEVPILSYNNETELSAIVNLVYLSARDRYQMEREDKAGKGYVDFIFYPVRRGDDGIILELKVNDTPENAIQQIKDRNYKLRFLGKLGEKSRCTGRILAVGIGYDCKTKEHRCKVEVL